MSFEHIFCYSCTSKPRLFRAIRTEGCIPPKSRKRLLHKAFSRFLSVFQLDFSVLHCSKHSLCRQKQAFLRLFPLPPSSRSLSSVTIHLSGAHTLPATTHFGTHLRIEYTAASITNDPPGRSHKNNTS